MGRGQETDLLFNPPINRSPRKKLKRGRQGKLERESGELLLAETIAVTRGYEGDLRFLDEELKEIKSREQRMTDDAVLAVQGSNVAWGDAEGFALRQLNSPENPLGFRDGPGGQVLALHLDETHLYCLRREEGTASDTVLERISFADFDDPSAPWTVVYKSESPVKAISRGDQTVLWFAENNNPPSSPSHLISLTSEGVEPILDISNSQALLDAAGDPLVVPGQTRGEYFLVAIDEEGKKTLHCLRPVSEEGIRDDYLGDGQSREIATLDPREDVRGLKIRDMAWRDNQGVILTEEELVLFDAEGISRVLPIEGEISYDRLELVRGGRALLWQRGPGHYLEVFLP